MASRTQAKPEKVSYTFPAPAVPISASLSHPSVNECHCSGVNAVVVDAARSLMYSAGRDTSIRAWSFGDHRTLTSAKTAPSASSIPSSHETVSIYHLDYHSDWVNDLCLVRDGSILVSCGSDQKIVISDVQNLWSDPWSPLLSACIGQSSNSKVVGAWNSGAESASRRESGVSQKPAGVRYSHSVMHSDYVKKVKCDVGNEGGDLMVFSVGLDGQLKISTISSEGGRWATLQSYHAKTSLYALASQKQTDWWLLAAGGADGLIKIFDSRDDSKHAHKLKGHTDMIKTLLMPESHPNTVVSGSADGSIRIWDLRVGKSLHSLALHDDSVWALADVPSSAKSPSDSGLQFYSGGRDGTVYWTNVDAAETKLLFKEPHPILSIAPVDAPKQQSLWISTTDPCITRWELNSINPPDATRRPPSLHLATSPILTSSISLGMSPSSLGSVLEVEELNAHPLLSTQQAISKTPSRAALVAHHTLPDRHRIITKDSTGRAQIWNVVKMTVEQDLGITSQTVEEIAASCTITRYLPSWFTAETRSGQLTIHVDPYPRCIEACYTSEESLKKIERDIERPLELVVAHAFRQLFKRYLEDRRNLEKEALRDPHSLEAAREDSPLEEKSEQQPQQQEESQLDVIVTVSKDTAFLWREHSVNVRLDTHTLPEWVYRVCTEVCMKTKNMPSGPGISFSFDAKRKDAFRVTKDPHHEYTMQRCFTVTGMIDFLLQKMRQNGRGATLSREQVTVTVEDKELPHSMDLGTIKHLYWKNSAAIALLYDYPEGD